MGYLDEAEVRLPLETLEDRDSLKGAMEAILFASGDPIKVTDLANLLLIVPDTCEVLLEELAKEFQQHGRGITLIRLGDKVQLATKGEYSTWVKKLATVNERQSLSKGNLECLAIVAYRQPVTRVEVDAIRGVSSDYVMNKLTERGLITVIGRKNVPGKPKLYATTDEFLRQFGFSDLELFKKDPRFLDLMDRLAEHPSPEEALDILPTEDSGEDED